MGAKRKGAVVVRLSLGCLQGVENILLKNCNDLHFPQ